MLDDIVNQERNEPNRNHPGVDIDAFRKAVLVERHSAGIGILRLAFRSTDENVVARAHPANLAGTHEE
ncbi:hypothetical protein [Pseudomonas syringae]|uniref:hypothetical protein n=1 Tax=Pseudomonas syringae TaxID=317 RepID=UPI001F2A9DB0|nr:hypothetical protein [Pseudomonas syringae]MCF5725533.1 hypothetical protein [Pseudomonas syringae]